MVLRIFAKTLLTNLPCEIMSKEEIGEIYDAR